MYCQKNRGNRRAIVKRNDVAYLLKTADIVCWLFCYFNVEKLEIDFIPLYSLIKMHY